MIIDNLFENNKKTLIAESSTYKQFHRVGRMLAERKMSEKEILDVFAQAEQGMTNTATGANRTALGRGKDVVGQGITTAKDAITKVLSSIQNSAPVAGVDVAYDQATDALANAVGNNSKIMDSIKKYRLLAKEYPKTQLFVKTALIALAGLATGGAGLPVIAGLTAAVDSAIKGEKLSNIIGKGAGAGLMALGAQEVNSMLSGADSAATPDAGQSQDFQLPDADAAENAKAQVDAAQDWLNADEAGKAEIEKVTGMPAAQLQDIAVSNDLKPDAGLSPGEEIVPSASSATGAEGFGGGTYTVQAGDQGGYIAQANGISFPDLKGLNPQITNWNKLQPGTELQLPPANTHTGSVWDGSAGNASYDLAKHNTVKESVRFKKLPANELIDQKLTVLSWALNESVGRKSNSMNLTTKGVYTVFENIDRYRKALVEATGPGRGQLPDYYRPDMPGAPAPQSSQPGAIGKGLNWLDRAAKKVGGAVSSFGHQFTTGVTKEKLKMNWHQKGKPTDSDQLAAFLSQQGVPPAVIQDVYGSMGIEYDPATAGQTFNPNAVNANAASGLEVPDESGMINPATGKGWTKSELAQSRQEREADAARASQYSAIAKKVAGSSKDELAATMGLTPSAKTAPATTPTATPGAAPASTAQGWDDPKSANYVGRREVARRQAAKPAAPAPAKPNYAGPSGYASVKMNTPTSPSLAAPKAPAAPAAPKVVSGGPTAAEKAALDKRIAAAAAQPVAETIRQVMKMLEAVSAKQDAQFIKNYIDVQFGSNLTETAKAQRNKLIEHVTKVTAIRRRQFAKAN